MGLFRRREPDTDAAREPLQPDERMVFDALLAGDGLGLAALRAQAESRYQLGIARWSLAELGYQVNVNVDEDRLGVEAIPGLPTLDLDDATVTVEELPERLDARLWVHDGMLGGLIVTASGGSDDPRHLTFTDVSYRSQVGSVSSIRDTARVADFERLLARSATAEAAPKWLREAIPGALRSTARSEAILEDLKSLGVRDVSTLSRWVQARRYGDLTLFSGEEFIVNDESEVVVASGLDGSAYTVSANGRVRHHPLDQSGAQDCGQLRTWLRQVGREAG